MSITIRELFSRQGIDNELVSLRNSLENHYQGLQMGLREAHQKFLIPVDGDGYNRGCHKPSQLVAGDLAYVVPSWVPVHSHDTRTVEGILTTSKISSTDFPLKPWHTYYDWCFHVRVDTQYTYLHSVCNVHAHGNEIECEWDTAFLPAWAWPQDGDRVLLIGRWIQDCGHPDETHGHKTEIHPPKAVVSFRSETDAFSGNSNLSRASKAIVYIGQHGGYWDQAINDQNYAFDLYLPPKPSPESTVTWNVFPQTNEFPVQPQIKPYPPSNPRLLRVVIPLQGVTPHPVEYGAIISGGWSDPHQIDAAQIHRLRVTLQKIHMDSDLDSGPDEWHVYIGINGRWHIWQDIGGWEKPLNVSVDLDLHANDKIHITACGFEADAMHDHMGHDSGYNWAQISNPNITTKQREDIEDSVFWQLSDTLTDENDKIGYFSKFHDSSERGSFIHASIPAKDEGSYRLEYKIEDR
jgi:hypothetical protein